MLKLVSVLAAGWVGMGGWAVVTIQELPEYFVAGRPYTIEFNVRQHGHNLLNDLEPTLIVRSGSNEQRIAAKAKAAGTYAATFTAPAGGPLTLTIKSGFGASNLELYPAPVVAAGARAPTISAVDRGRALFIAKGCNACHTNSDLVDRPDNQQIKVGPELGARGLARDYVMQKVKNPKSEIMPDLGLNDAEISAIASFLTAGGTAATGGGGR